ncbi:hypothetical protein D9M71_579080 [compost metagenome]
MSGFYRLEKVWSQWVVEYLLHGGVRLAGMSCQGRDKQRNTAFLHQRESRLGSTRRADQVDGHDPSPVGHAWREAKDVDQRFHPSDFGCTGEQFVNGCWVTEVTALGDDGVAFGVQVLADQLSFRAIDVGKQYSVSLRQTTYTGQAHAATAADDNGQRQFFRGLEAVVTHAGAPYQAITAPPSTTSVCPVVKEPPVLSRKMTAAAPAGWPICSRQ